MKKPKINEEHKPTYKIIYILGGAYLFLTLLHFGIQFYDLDRLISNFLIGFLILGFGWVVKKLLEFGQDVKAINKLCNDILNK